MLVITLESIFMSTFWRPKVKYILTWSFLQLVCMFRWNYEKEAENRHWTIFFISFSSRWLSSRAWKPKGSENPGGCSTRNTPIHEDWEDYGAIVDYLNLLVYFLYIRYSNLDRKILWVKCIFSNGILSDERK